MPLAKRSIYIFFFSHMRRHKKRLARRGCWDGCSLRQVLPVQAWEPECDPSFPRSCACNFIWEEVEPGRSLVLSHWSYLVSTWDTATWAWLPYAFTYTRFHILVRTCAHVQTHIPIQRERLGAAWGRTLPLILGIFLSVANMVLFEFCLERPIWYISINACLVDNSSVVSCEIQMNTELNHCGVTDFISTSPHTWCRIHWYLFY